MNPSAKKSTQQNFSKIGLPGTVLDRFPVMLSGGEQQKVSIARTFCMDTNILLADAPTGNLDSKNSDHIFAIGLVIILATFFLDNIRNIRYMRHYLRTFHFS